MNNALSSYIKIVFENSDSGNNKTGTATMPSDPAQVNADNPIEAKGKGNFAKVGSYMAVKNIAKSAINYGASNIGKFTGSNYAQAQVDTAMQLVGYGAMIAANPLLGSIAVATDLIFKGVDKAYDRYWEKQEINQQRARYGMDTLGRS